jgi:orotate phosphoribosyltransferase
MTTHHEQLRQLIERKCLKYGHFVLSTGTPSNWYFDCKGATLDGECLSLIADELLALIRELPQPVEAIGGLTMGADFIVAAVVMRAYLTGQPTVRGSIVRKEPKKHGTSNMIENELSPGTRIVVVDDVITSGTSTLKACKELEAAGYHVVGVLALVDREAGGLEMLEQRYSHARALFRKRDFSSLLALEREDAERARHTVAG